MNLHPERLQIDFARVSLKTLELQAAFHNPTTLKPPELRAARYIAFLTYLNDQTLGIAADNPRDHRFTSVMSPYEAGRAINQTTAVVNALLRDQEAICVPILFGATPGIARLSELRLGFRQNPIYPILIQRSQGAELNGSRVIGRLDAVILQRAKLIVVFDDLIDHVGALATAAGVIRSTVTNDPEPYWRTQLRASLDRVHAADFGQGAQLYQAFCEDLVADGKIVVAAPFSKNRPMIDSLKRISGGNSLRARAQRELIQPTRFLTPTDWVMGMGVDTGVPWKHIAQIIESERPDLLKHPKTSWVFQAMENNLIRVGNSTPGLVRVNGASSQKQYQTVVEFSATQWIRRLDRLVG